VLTLALCLVAGLSQDVPVEVAAPGPTVAETRAALDQGVAWLLDNQRPDGGWGSHHSSRPIEVFCSPPGSHQAFRVATTGLVLSALMEAPVERTARLEAAIEQGFEHLLAEHDVKRQSGVEHYNVWAFGYTLQAMGERLIARPRGPRAARLRAAAKHLVEKLGRYQSVDGGWGYLSLWGYETYQPAATSMSFTTAAILVGLERVRRAGVEVPEELVQPALRCLQRCRTPRGDYTYGEYWNRIPGAGINGAAGAACRTTACQVALELFGVELAEAAHERALRNLLVTQARFQELGLRRPIPHESWHQISGYFYLFGHAYAGYELEGRADIVRERYGPALVEKVMLTRQPDGSFWDYPLYSYHKPYGTAFALIALTHALPCLGR
jgi:hypothetical protein